MWNIISTFGDSICRPTRVCCRAAFLIRYKKLQQLSLVRRSLQCSWGHAERGQKMFAHVLLYTTTTLPNRYSTAVFHQDIAFQLFYAQCTDESDTAITNKVRNWHHFTWISHRYECFFRVRQSLLNLEAAFLRCLDQHRFCSR